jgi:hypothetical protein
MLNVIVTITKPGQVPEMQPGIYSSTIDAIMSAIDTHGDDLVGAKISVKVVRHV